MASNSTIINGLPPDRVNKVLREWYGTLSNPDKVRGKFEEIPRNQVYLFWYFTLLGKSLKKISSSLAPPKKTDFPGPATLERSPSSVCQEQPDKKKENQIRQKICSQTNPYDFAITLQEVVREVILLEQDIEKPEEKEFNAEVFVLYYFHRRQLEKLAIKEFWPDLQIGRTLAAFVLTNHLNEG
ncbi:MAG: hypothetical protein ACK47N_08540 [Microcystis sp.]|jgi:hypothetical protein|uniref:hypothetical protein n=1 Tax=Microcystis sp. TaxID=1127 RepID=UPI00391BAFEB